MKYLIMKCEELRDQYECDAARTPITMTDNWKTWYKDNNPDYYFEVYEYKNNHFTCIKDYTTSTENGMVFVWFDENTPEYEFNVITRFPDYNRDMPIPKDLYARAKMGEDFEDALSNCGYISWNEGDTYYAYTEYHDNHICCPY